MRKNKGIRKISIDDTENNLVNQLASESFDESDNMLAREKMVFLDVEIQKLPNKLKEALLLYQKTK